MMALAEDTKTKRARGRSSVEAPPPARRQTDRPVRLPRVDLLPPIVGVRRKQSATVRLLMLALVGLALITVAASFAVSMFAGIAEATLKSEQARSQQLIAAQADFGELSSVKSQLLAYEDAQVAALYAEADWARIMRDLDSALPESIVIDTEAIMVKGTDAETDAAPAESVGLDAPGVVEISFTATAPKFISNTALLNGLQKMTGHVSATVSAVAGSDGEGYQITGVVQLDSTALGATGRVADLDQEQLAELREELQTSVTEPPAPEAPADGTATDEEAGE